MDISVIITVICAIFASSGFWSFLATLNQRKKAKNSAENQMLKGLGHDRIMDLGQSYISRGYITPDEYENLHDYLFTPYKALGGNGSAERIMQEVAKLPSNPPNAEKGD